MIDTNFMSQRLYALVLFIHLFIYLCIYLFSRVAEVREKYLENEIFPGQGKVREFRGEQILSCKSNLKFEVIQLAPLK